MNSDEALFEGLFDSSMHLFRLELLTEYSVPEEQEALHAFLQGEPRSPSDFNSDWISFLDELQERNALCERLHAVPQRLTPYLRFEIDWGYSASASHAEKIYLCRESDVRALSGSAIRDFWLFDHSHAFEMYYSDSGVFDGIRMVRDGAQRKAYLAIAAHAAAIGISLNTYLSRDRQGLPPFE